ncbi:hypothetical protein HRbin40_00581 [bacterium HR40]|nr:hypothetical protein HRbin40_00581 [bacterium HR40]
MSAVRKRQAREAGQSRVDVGQLGFERLLSEWVGQRVDHDEHPLPVLAFADLVPDEGGEVVLRPGGLDRRVRLLVPLLPVEQGRSVPHVTAAGEDVTGMRFVRFAGGPVVHLPADVELEFVLVGA